LTDAAASQPIDGNENRGPFKHLHQPVEKSFVVVMFWLKIFLIACVGKSAVFGADSVFQSGAPRPMKMGTTPSRFPYDAEARDTLQSASLRCSAI